MSTVTHSSLAADIGRWLGEAESWLDDRGKGAWIAVIVLGFILFWPVGLVLLFYALWGRKPKALMPRSRTDNAAFEAYRAEIIARLDEEQEQFESFIERLRAARDQAEFDRFLDDRVRAAREIDAGEDAG